MQISKLYLPLGAVAILSLSFPLHAQETDAQAKAREALRQKIAELNAETAVIAPAAPAVPAAPVAPVVVIPPPPVAPEPPVVVVAPVAAPAPVAVTAPSPVDDATAARAREALRQKMMELDAQSGVATTTTPGVTFTPTQVVSPNATTAITAPPVAAGYKPIEVPASPLTGTKEARLAALLQQYRADQITPEQYHTQRAAIIAEP